jgi:parallel beta-helix repeat protein
VSLALFTCTVASAASPVRPVPGRIASGSTVWLQCGTTYQGTLELNGKERVTVTTAGKCGKARISPGRAISGWTRYAGKIYSAPVNFTPVQVAIDDVAVSPAHWPNQAWARDSASMPSADLAGASLVVLANQSVVSSSTLTENRVGTALPFYVEGKLWMLDSPGEWALHNGRLYLWTPDGLSPEGRTWAAPGRNGINADRSYGIVIDGVAIFSAADGISADGATNLTVRNTDIINSYRDGIWASGSRGLQVRGTHVANARRNGIDGWYWIAGARISDSTVSNTGMLGMPGASDAAILLGGGNNNRVDNVRVTNSAYHGINMLHSRHSEVRDSVIDTACARLADCGAIYASARDRQPLAMLIEGNTVTNTKGTAAIGIYLDDYANGVTVHRNTVSNNQRGLVIHNGFNNAVTNNTFSDSAVQHIGLIQDAGDVHHVRITGNTFMSMLGEQTFNLETRTSQGEETSLGPHASYRPFATYDYNTYISNNWTVFGHVWDGAAAGKATSYDGWRELMQQDIHSVRVNAGAAVQESRGASPRRGK